MQKRAAFTLVELSIVLAIVGLLAGGILTGRSMIRSASLRTVVTEARNFETAANAFKTKYSFWPGDFPNAYALWGDPCGDDSANYSKGCNGDGNGIIRTNGGENIKAWEHLSRAGMISGSYTGWGNEDGTNETLEMDANNSPSGKLKRSFWAIGMLPYGKANTDPSWGDYYEETNIYDAGHNRQTLTIGDLSREAPFRLDESSDLTLEEAWSIDTKLDDGFFATGSVTGHPISIQFYKQALLDGKGGCDEQNGTDPYCLIKRGKDSTQEVTLSFTLRDQQQRGL